MRLAFTADLHLTDPQQHPERFETLENILIQCGELDVNLLIIAGDLFAHSLPNYDSFERLFHRTCPPGLSTIIIPGNHDSRLSASQFAVKGIKIYQKPRFLPLNSQWALLLVPYRDQSTFGEAIAPFTKQLEDYRWILTGHGDWTQGLHPNHPYKPGVYMPLTRMDLQRYRPDYVILGHIHKPTQQGRVYSPGSPCPLTINETGGRRFLILDTDTNRIISQAVSSPVIFFKEKFVLSPQKDQLDDFRKEIQHRIESWNLPDHRTPKISIQVAVTGFATDRQKVQNIIQEEFSEYCFHDPQGPDLSELYHRLDPDRDRIAQLVSNWIEEIDWSDHPSEPSREDILEEALKLIYGSK